MFDFMIGLLLSVPLGFALGYFFANYKHHKSELSYNINTIKEDLVNIQLQLSNFVCK